MTKNFETSQSDKRLDELESQRSVSATADSIAVRGAAGTLKATDGVEDDDLVTLLQRTQLNQQITKAMKAYNQDDSSLNLMYARQGYIDSDETTTFDLLHTFTRATSKYVFNERGVLVEALSGQPAFSYDPVTGEPKGIDIEESRTNLLTYSSDFTDASWIKGGNGAGSVPIITANYGIAPDDTMTADRIQFALNGGTTASDQSVITKTVSATAGLTYSNTLFLKSNDGNSYDLLFATTVGSSTLTKVTVTPDDWTRVSLNNTPISPSINMYFGLRNVSPVTGLSDSADILAWGAQIEQGAFPTSVIPTAGTTVTRAADVCTIESIDSSDWWNPNEGTFVVEFEQENDVTAGLLVVSDNNVSTSTERVGIVTGLSGNVEAQIRTSGSTGVSLILGGKTQGRNKVAISFDGGNLSASMNGGGVFKGSAAKVPELSVAILGASSSGSNPFPINGTVSLLKYEPVAVSDARLQELSTL